MSDAVDKLLTGVTKDIDEVSRYIDKTADEDYIYARQNIMDNIEITKQIVDKLVDVSESEEHPQWYKIALEALRDSTVLNEKLLDISKKLKDVRGMSGKSFDVPNPDGAQSTLVFAGSTKDLQKFLKSQSKSDVIDAEVVENKKEEK